MSKEWVQTAVDTVACTNLDHLTTYLEAIKPKIVWGESKLSVEEVDDMWRRRMVHPRSYGDLKRFLLY